MNIKTLSESRDYIELYFDRMPSFPDGTAHGFQYFLDMGLDVIHIDGRLDGATGYLVATVVFRKLETYSGIDGERVPH
jgi:hypothetical protein